jgi:hypothetical protein
MYPFGVFITAKNPGKIHFYLDNFRIRRGEKKITLWTSGKPEFNNKSTTNNIKVINIAHVDLSKI